MTKPISILGASAVLLASCTIVPTAGPDADKTWRSIPGWASNRMKQSWWKKLDDPHLNRDINNAFANNPDLAVIAARLERADAVVSKTRAASLPSLNLGIGSRDGRKKERQSTPYDLTPWAGGGQLSWEVDLSGRLRAATKSAKLARDAAFWDLHAARLQLASRIAAVRSNLYRFNAEVSLLRESIQTSRKTTSTLKAQADAGIAANTAYLRQQAEEEKMNRQLLDLQRKRAVTVVQLRTLTGSSAVTGTSRRALPQPPAISNLTLSQLMKANPTLLAAEARVRSAFQLEKSAKLDLLPSFRLNASATGGGSSLSGRYKVWQHQFGPSLDIPVYDPVRLANVKVRKAEAKAAAAQYRAAVLKVLQEVDRATINYRSRQAQLRVVRREVTALAQNHQHAVAQFKAGITSQLEYLDTQRRWLEAKRSEAAIQYLRVNDYIQLTKALGG